jgi:hypothetical protein
VRDVTEADLPEPTSLTPTAQRGLQQSLQQRSGTQWFVDISAAVDHLTRRGNYVFDQATEKEQNDALAYRFSVHRAAALHGDLELDEEKTTIEKVKFLAKPITAKL